jgi:hypothetical protein
LNKILERTLKNTLRKWTQDKLERDSSSMFGVVLIVCKR